MKLLVISAIPGSHHFGYALKEAFLRGLKGTPHTSREIDLYADHFDPVLTDEELKKGPSEIIQRHQEMIRGSDWLVFFYPIWWFKAPAILEGWFDRVMTRGFAFKYKMITKTFGIPIGLLPCQKAMVFETYGSPGWAMKLFYFDLAWRRIKRGILKFCGVKKFRRFAFFSAPYASEEKKKKWIEKVEKVGREM